MSKESKPKRTRSTKSNTAELEAKIAELEARLANLSSQVQPSAKPAETREAPKPQARPAPPPPRPAASGPTHGTLPAGMKPAPKPAPAPEPREAPSAPQPGEVAPAYATISSTEYTGNKYFATRKRLSYHPPDKQFTGSSTMTTTRIAPPPPPPEYRPEPQVSQQRGTLPAGTKHEEKKSMWRSKGAEYENYASEETKHAPPPQQERPAPPPPPRPAASGPTHGTLPAGMKPAPKPEPKPAPRPDVVSSDMPQSVGEVAPAYATISSTEYTGNRYYATRKRMSYHPPDKQFTGSGSSTSAPQPAEPPKPKVRRGTLPAGFKP